jgi:hypothetical protein
MCLEANGRMIMKSRILTMAMVALNTADFGDFAEHHGLVLLSEREPERRR